MKKVTNAAILSHPLAYAPVAKQVVGGEGGIDSLRYVDRPQAVDVYENGDVEFRFYAPTAESVEVAGMTGTFKSDKIALERQEDGYFTKRVSGIPGGFHYCDWYVDGVRVANPDGRFYGGFRMMNFFDIPEEADDFYFRREVPHGTVRIELYPSSVNGRTKYAYVYTPPSYEQEPQRQYPVLYLQHGVCEDETSWLWSGRANFILDNLIAEGKCEEMILVMNSGYAFRKGEDPVFYPGDFDSELVYDCIPFIGKNFRVKDGRANRAVAGLSLGAAQAALSAARHPDLFGYLGVFSGASSDGLEKIIREGLTYGHIFLSSGAFEGMAAGLKSLKERLEQAGNPVSAGTYPGFHEWSPWRHSLHDFVQRIFRPEAVCREYPSSLQEDRKAGEVYDGPNQALALNPLFNDPFYKTVVFDVDENGRPAGRYADIRTGIEVLGSGSVRFSMEAAEAKQVTVRFSGRELELAREADGVWRSVTAEGVEPGFHYVYFYVDGVQVVHPFTQCCNGGFCVSNYFEMEDPGFTDYLLKDVPHGSIRLLSYRSSIDGRDKPLYVYAPAGYDQSGKAYPTLYLQHGGGENETGWIWHGKVQNLMDNLIAEGRCPEMLVVMAEGYSFKPDGSSHHALGSFEEEMISDIVPFADARFRTIPQREYRAMAGLSMGAMQAHRTVFDHPEVFANGGFFSGVFYIKDNEVDNTAVLFDRERFEETYRLIFVGCGEQDERLYQGNLEAMELLKGKYRLPIEFFHVPGVHNWTFWRKALKEFVERLWREKNG
ncbi:MAG: alpha/beta hydrolase-fold protein [Roseburia sp.]|nr:alpha/beta hydrolase-fold protein [Roseburia sp.]MCM1097991.1 alpha/beta hydrolase-fold protein [Ruminococcus flavefaciens]